MTFNHTQLTLIENQEKLRSLVKLIPALPGCYLMKDNDDRILYIGKSKNLRSRVSSYFRRKSDLSPRITLMVRQVVDIEFIVTDNDNEALTLESNLIKKNKPYYNILLKDDKKYPYLCITWSDDYPRIYVTRRRRNRHRKDRYYGPYVDVTLLRNTLTLIKKIFPVRQRIRPLYKDKTCLNYSIGRCPGVCQEIISSEEYRETVKTISMVFQGRSEELSSILYSKMMTHSKNQEYEKAQVIKEQLSGLNKLNQSQKITDPDSSINRDVIAYSSNQAITCVQLFQIRSGKIIGRLAFSADTGDQIPTTILKKVIEEHYSDLDSVEIPSEIIIETEIKNQKMVQIWLSEIKGRNVSLICPKRNTKSHLIKLVKKNAQIELERISLGFEKASESLEDLANILELTGIPKRIEGYDISHIQGSYPVASQVVFINGIPAKHHYRKYKITSEEITIGHSDDYLALYEVILRRFKRWSNYKKQGLDLAEVKNANSSVLNSINASDLPDLVMIDGGKGQLNSALRALNDLDLENEIRLCSLAKKREEVFVPGTGNPLPTQIDDPGLLLLRRVRDEAHRFALTFHRDRRSKSLRRTELSEIPGLGPKRIRVLLEHFQSKSAIRLATKEQLKNIPGLGDELAISIWSYFNT